MIMNFDADFNVLAAYEVENHPSDPIFSALELVEIPNTNPIQLFVTGIYGSTQADIHNLKTAVALVFDTDPSSSNRVPTSVTYFDQVTIATPAYGVVGSMAGIPVPIKGANYPLFAIGANSYSLAPNGILNFTPSITLLGVDYSSGSPVITQVLNDGNGNLYNTDFFRNSELYGSTLIDLVKTDDDELVILSCNWGTNSTRFELTPLRVDFSGLAPAFVLKPGKRYTAPGANSCGNKSLGGLKVRDCFFNPATSEIVVAGGIGQRLGQNPSSSNEHYGMIFKVPYTTDSNDPLGTNNEIGVYSVFDHNDNYMHYQFWEVTADDLGRIYTYGSHMHFGGISAIEGNLLNIVSSYDPGTGNTKATYFIGGNATTLVNGFHTSGKNLMVDNVSRNLYMANQYATVGDWRGGLFRYPLDANFPASACVNPRRMQAEICTLLVENFSPATVPINLLLPNTSLNNDGADFVEYLGCETCIVSIESSGCSPLNLNAIGSFSGSATFEWNPGTETTQSIDVLTPGNYSVVVTDGRVSCTSEIQICLSAGANNQSRTKAVTGGVIYHPGKLKSDSQNDKAANSMITPNPANQSFNLSTPAEKEISNITIYNSAGSSVVELTSPKSRNSINVEKLSNGNYSVVIYFTDGTKESSSLVVQH